MNAQDSEFIEFAITEAVGLSVHGLDLGVGSFQRAGEALEDEGGYERRWITTFDSTRCCE